MADIELVIRIPEEAHKLLKNEGVDWLGAEHILNAVANGIPLPKGHGRLIDADLLKNQFPIWVDNFSSHTVNNTISKAPTIIEADREESEEV